MAASPIVPNFQDPNAKLRVYTESDVKGKSFIITFFYLMLPFINSTAINEELQRSRADRVRAALFPETVGDPSKIPSLQMHRDVPTAIQFLSPPCLELRDAIADIINYQLDADFAQKFIPEIVKLLGDPDPDVVRNAAELTKDLTNSEAACTVATKSPQLVSALMRAANNASDDNKTDLLIKAGVAGKGITFHLYPWPIVYDHFCRCFAEPDQVRSRQVDSFQVWRHHSAGQTSWITGRESGKLCHLCSPRPNDVPRGNKNSSTPGWRHPKDGPSA